MKIAVFWDMTWCVRAELTYRSSLLHPCLGYVDKTFWSGIFREMLYRHCFSTLLWSMPLRGFRVNQDGLKLNGTHQLLAYADDVNILGGSVHTARENAEALVVATKEI
jgi:hypothetical protein